MAGKDFYFKSLKFTNYRGLKSLSIDKLKRINLIGGFNGTGKTTLLEGLFYALDRRSPAAIARPHAMRNIGFSGIAGISSWFYGQNTENPMVMDFLTASGELSISFKFGKRSANPQSSYIAGNNIQLTYSGKTSDDYDVLTIESKLNKSEEDIFLVEPKLDSITVNSIKLGQSQMPVAVMLSAASRLNNEDLSSRYSTAIRGGKIQEVLEIVRDINPDVVDFQLLHEAGSTVLYAKLSDEKLYPTSMLGDGFFSILSIALMITAAKGGVILLDEFDSTIHYSAQSGFWKRVATLARKYSCQIFAVTHSMDCIKSAYEGVKLAQCDTDFQYLRLERTNGDVQAISYDSSELHGAISADWEVR